MSRLSSIAFSVALLSTAVGFAQEENTASVASTENPTSQPSSQKKQKKKHRLDDGFYVGIGGGYNWYTIHRHVQATILDDPLFNETAYAYPTHMVGTLFLGYGHTLNCPAYLGVEGYIDLTNAHSHEYTTVFSDAGPYVYKTATTARFGYGCSLLPGYKWRDSSLVYLKFGFTQTRFKELEKEYLTTAANGQPFLKTTKYHSANGFSYGIGVEEALYWGLSLRGEFSHTTYQSFTNTYTSFVSSTKVSLQPSNTEFVLSLIWHFWNP